MRVIRHHGVKVDRDQQMVMHLKIPLDRVDQVMAFHHITVGGKLNMEADQLAAGPVIMHHQIMDAQHTGVTQGFFLNVIDQFRVRGRAQQRADGIPH